jgi:alkanesulfonate monooxygenase SsuD/methylene tetrahydromethanopterin reductase-like flavin-dependent oxidoreductase (luciferase family)
MTMKFGLALGQDVDIRDVAEYTKAAEDAGFEHVTFIDMGNLATDVNVTMTVALMGTERVAVGHGVTDPIMFHPATIAGAVATMRELAGDRAFVGLGVGGPYGKPYVRSAKVAELQEAITFIKDYTAGREGTFGGNTWHNEWIRRSSYNGTSVPVTVAICGPKTCLAAGATADGVFSIGMDPSLQRWRKDLVTRAAIEAGRDPDEIDFWVRTQVYIAESREAAFEELAPYAATSAWELWKVLRRKTDDTVALADSIEAAHPGVLDELQAVYDNWDPYWTERIGGPQTKVLTQRVVDFFLASGTPEDVRQQLAAVDEVGITGASIVTYSVRKLHDMIEKLSDELINQPA